MAKPEVRTLLLAIFVVGMAVSPAFGATRRLATDPSVNRFEALKEFLFIEGYWEEETGAVLNPLEGELSKGKGTPDAHLVQNLDDIPGLRPLPDGVIEFLHRSQNVYYVSVGQDRLLVGIAQEITANDRGQSATEWVFEKFDLIEGLNETTPLNRARGPGRTEFLYAHQSFLGPALRLLALGVAVMAFLAVRFRRRFGRGSARMADPVVTAQRLRADARVYQAAGVVWFGLLAAIYGLMHFSGRIQFLEIAASSEALSLSMTRSYAIVPDQMRLLGFSLTVGLALVAMILLGLWAGVWGGRRNGARPAGRSVQS